MATTSTKKTYPSSGFKIYGSLDGKKVCDVSSEKHVREKNDELVDKGMKLKFEFTNDGFETKQIIMLERAEISDMIGVLTGVLSKMEAKRKDPVKNFSIEDQGQSFFIKFSKEKDQFAFKATKFDAVRILALATASLQKNFASELGSPFTKSEVIEFVSSVYSRDVARLDKVPENYVPPVDVSKKDVGNDKKIDDSETIACQGCGYALNTTKHAKIIEFSKKKHSDVLCLECQKKR